MADRHFPVHPNLRQLRRQAKDLLRAIRRRDAEALADLATHHPAHPDPDAATLVDAQLTLARSYGLTSWPRLVLACAVTDAICRDRVTELRSLLEKHPELINEPARGTASCNWGPPMSYAANLGRTRIIAMMRELGATDHATGHADDGGAPWSNRLARDASASRSAVVVAHVLTPRDLSAGARVS